MGCGGSQMKHTNISLEYLFIYPEKNTTDKIKIKRRAKEICKIQENLSLLKYIYISAKENNLFREIIRHEKNLKNCIFLISRKAAKTIKACDYKYIFSYVPYRDLEYAEYSDIIETLYILDTRTDHHLEISNENMIKVLENETKIVDKIVDVSEFESIKLNPKLINVSKITTSKEIIEDNGIDEPKIKGGMKISDIYIYYLLIKIGISIEIHSELDSDLLEEVLKKMNSNQKITSISIQNTKFLDLKLYSKLFEALDSCKTLTTLIISGNVVPTGFDTGINLIIKLLKNNKRIRNVNLSNNFIYTKYLIRILHEGLVGSRIYQLDLSQNFITFTGCQKLAEWLHHHRTLRSLNLQLNSALDFKREGCELILEELKYPINFQSLDLSHMVLTGFGLKMAEFINSCNTLKELKLKNVSINAEDMLEISKAVSDSKSIVYLNISDNSNSIDVSLIYIANMIINNSSIKILDLDRMNINSKSFNLFLKNAFEKNEKIEDLSLNGNNELKFEDLYEIFVKKMKFKNLTFTGTCLSKDKNEIELLNKFRELRKDVRIIVDDI